MSNETAHAVAMALSLIKKKGRSVTFRQRTNATPPDPAKPWEPGAVANVDHIVDMVILPTKLRQVYQTQRKEDTQIPEHREFALMGEQTFTPNLKDVVLDKGVEKTIVYIDPIEPGDRVVLYKMGLT